MSTSDLTIASDTTKSTCEVVDDSSETAKKDASTVVMISLEGKVTLNCLSDVSKSHMLAAGFSEKLAAHVLTDLYVTHVCKLDMHKIQEYVLKDFMESGVGSTMVEDGRIHDEDECETGLNTGQAEFRVVTGYGLHRHKNVKGLSMIYETRDQTASTVSLCALLVSYHKTEESSVWRTNPKDFFVDAEVSEKVCIEVVKTYLDSLAEKHKKTKTARVNVPHRGSGIMWVEKKIAPRSKSTVFLYKGLWDDIYFDAENFFSDSTEEFYKQHQINHNRVYLFKGDSGTGKTTAIRTLGSELDRPLYMFPMTYSCMDDDAFICLLNVVPPKSIVVIEDIDRVFTNHSDNIAGSGISFSSFINVLDGIYAPKGVMVVMTCTDDSMLDEAMMRRVSRTFEFKCASRTVALRMFNKFRPGNVELAKKFASEVSKIGGVNQASLQEFFVRHRKRSVEELVSDLTTLENSRKKEKNSGCI